MREVLEVLARPVVRRKFATVSGIPMFRVVGLLADAEVVAVGAVEAVSRDPKDDVFLATVTLARADYLVTKDLDLLVLQNHAGTEIIDTRTFARLLESR